jgi:hypothetical protein
LLVAGAVSSAGAGAVAAGGVVGPTWVMAEKQPSPLPDNAFPSPTLGARLGDGGEHALDAVHDVLEHQVAVHHLQVGGTLIISMLMKCSNSNCQGSRPCRPRDS